jgi:hypothetical protein
VDYLVPADDRPHYVDWDAFDVEPLYWWAPTTAHHGGMEATVVIDETGQMHVFHGRDRVGVAPAPRDRTSTRPGPDFWPVAVKLGDEPARLSHLLRDTGWMLCRDGDEFGLAAAIPEDHPDSMTWRLCEAFVTLGFFPPLGAGFTGEQAEFVTGMDAIGERAARRVKRALMDRLTHDRRELRALSDRIEATWRP